MPEELPAVAERLHHMAEDMSKTQKSAEGFNDVLKSSLRTLIGYDLVRHTLGQIIDRSKAYQAVHTAVSASQLDRNKLLRLQNVLEDRSANLVTKVMSQWRSFTDKESARHDTLVLRAKALNSQIILAKELEIVTKVGLGTMFAMLGVARELWTNQRRFNQDLIEANASASYRSELLRETLLLQTKLGINFEQATQAARALVHYGMDAETSFGANVRLVAQMEQGLGVSVNQSAQLASIVERQLKGSFESIAHVIAQIVDDTALAGDEAMRLANTIATAMGRLRPGLGAVGLPEVVRLVGRYESALKEVGGQAGGFQQLLTQLTTPEGMVGAGALGVNPDFLATEQGVQMVMDRFAQYGNRMLGQSAGWERQMRLKLLAEQFNISADAANQMLIAAKRASEQQIGSISVQDRWRNQLHATDQGIHRLINSLMGLLQGALYPFVLVAGAIVNKIADVVESILAYKNLALTLAGVLAVSVGYLGYRMLRLGVAMWGVVMSTNAVTAAMARLAAVQAGAADLTALARRGGGKGGNYIRQHGLWLPYRPDILPSLDILKSAGGALRGFFGDIKTGWKTFPWLTAGTAVKGFFGNLKAEWLNMASWKFARPPGAATVLSTAPSLGGLGTVSGTILRSILLVARGVSFLVSPLGLIVGALGLVGYFAAKTALATQKLYEETKKQDVINFSKAQALAARHQAQLYTAQRYGTSDEVAKALQNSLNDIAGSDVYKNEDPEEELFARKAASDKMLDYAKETNLRAKVTDRMFTKLTERSPAQMKREQDQDLSDGKMLKVNEAQKALLEKRCLQALEEMDRADLREIRRRALLDREGEPASTTWVI